MSRFEESALRDSASGTANPSTLPYWHPSSQFSSLINPQHDAGIGATSAQEPEVMPYGSFAEDHLVAQSQSTGLDFDLSGLQRHMNIPQFSDFPQTSTGLTNDMTPSEYSTPAMPQLAQSLTIKTPTGGRSMRRPGLAGASALVNGQYCCQWSVNGAACRHKFLDAKQLNDHIRSHHVRGAGNFVCYWSGCDKGRFPTANKLVRHVHSHTGYKPFSCPSCTQAFVTKDQLDKHHTTHTGAKDYVCTWPGCGRSFAVKHALDGHMNSVHLKAKKHICPHCRQAFDDSSNLSKHKKQVHNLETGIKCPARHTHGCTYVDSRKDKMKEHCQREQHGLETTTDPHAWNLWVQQFKTSCRKADCRRHAAMSSRPMSRMSSLSTPTFVSTPRRTPSVECSGKGCLPCHSCDELDILEPCSEDCDPGDACLDPECEVDAHITPCSLPHCRSASSTPPPGSYFELFHDTAHPFSRLNDYL